MMVWHILNDVGSAFRWFPTSSMTNSNANRWGGGFEEETRVSWSLGGINSNLEYVCVYALCIFVYSCTKFIL